MRGLLKTYYQKNHNGSTHNAVEQKHATFEQSPAYERKGSQDDLHEADRPKTKEELKHERILERQRLRVAKAAARRDDWVNLNVHDNDFIMGFQYGAIPLYHNDNMRFRDFSAPGRSGLTGSIPKTSMDHGTLNKFPTYDHSEYDSKNPSNHNNFRPRNMQQESGSPIMKYVHKDQNERIQEKIQSIPKLSTEPLNTLLLIKPKWREHDESKWVGGKEFQSMMSRKDQGWQPLSNVMEEHPEPFIEQKVQFRATGGGVASLSSSNKKTRRNLSSIKNTAPNTHVPSQFRNSPNRSNGAIPALIEESPEPKLFDSTIPHDKTWYSRVVQSTSLRQKHHLNQSIKLRKNLTEGITKEHPMLDMRTQIDLSKNESPMKYAVIQDVDLSREVSPEKGKPLSPITQEETLTSGGRGSLGLPQMASWNPTVVPETQPKKKPPLPKKEHMLSVEKVAPDVAAGYLNGEFQQSYTNSWQYNVVVRAPQTYHNTKFPEKQQLNEAHILWEMDREKTYFRSAMDRINPQQIMNQFETEKLRRTNMMMSLNHNVMNKTLAPSDSLIKGGSHSLKKLPTQMSSSKKSPHRDEEEDDHTPVFKANYSQGGPTPVKQMSMTMPHGFTSPKTLKKTDLNKKEIKEVVKSYFDKPPGTQPMTPFAATQEQFFSTQNGFSSNK